jgi:hypothetical protein
MHRMIARGARCPGVASILAVLLATVLVVPAGAAASSRAACVANWRDTVSPGVSLSAAAAAFTSHGETGTITCDGSINGHHVTGPGTIGEEGALRGTCAAGSGSARLSLTIPTTAGPARLQIPVEFTFVAGLGLRRTDIFPGGFAFAPLQGNCITSPITEVAIFLHGIVWT